MDGVQDADEPGIADVTVELYDNGHCTGTPVATTVTDAQGDYAFTVPSGQYAVRFVLPDGYAFTKPNYGADDALDSDADPDTGCSGTVIVPAGGRNATVDAGLIQLAALGNYIWSDLNQNGIQDPDEPGIPGVTVELYRGDICSGSPIATTTTDDDGYYLFNNLIPDTYALRIILPDGYQFTLPNNGEEDKDSDADPSTGCIGSVNLQTGETNVDVDAGLVPLSALGNWVWLDANQNGIQDDGYEAGIPDVTVELYDNGHCTGTPIKTVQTSGQGYYIFPDLPDGTYSIRFDLPDGYAYSPYMAPGSTALTDSNADPDTNGCTGPIQLPVGVTDKSWDAGMYPVAAPTPTPIPTPKPTPTPPPPAGNPVIYLPIILTPGDQCEIARVNTTVWGQFFSFPVDNQIHIVPPLPWQTSTTFRLFNYTGDHTWYLYEPYYRKQVGGDAFVYEGGHPGEPFSLYLFTDCGFILITSHVDPPDLLSQAQLEAISQQRVFP